MPSLTDLQVEVNNALNEIKKGNFEYVRGEIWPHIKALIISCDELDTPDKIGWMRYFLYQSLDGSRNFKTPSPTISVTKLLLDDIKRKTDKGEKSPKTPDNNTDGIV